MCLMIGAVIPAIFNEMPIVLFKVVRLTPTIIVSETLRSSAGLEPGEIMY